MIWIPFAVLFVAAFIGLFHHAHKIYLEAETAREALEDELAKERRKPADMTGTHY